MIAAKYEFSLGKSQFLPSLEEGLSITHFTTRSKAQGQEYQEIVRIDNFAADSVTTVHTGLAAILRN